MKNSLAGRIRMCIDEAKETPWSSDITNPVPLTRK